MIQQRLLERAYVQSCRQLHLNAKFCMQPERATILQRRELRSVRSSLDSNVTFNSICETRVHGHALRKSYRLNIDPTMSFRCEDQDEAEAIRGSDVGTRPIGNRSLDAAVHLLLYTLFFQITDFVVQTTPAITYYLMPN